MKHEEDIIVRPYVTEKSNMEIANGKYTFIVNKKSTKTEIKIAVERLFQVKVISVNTVNYDGKEKRVGVHQGTTEAFKKAMVKIDTNPKPVSYLTKGGKEIATSKKYKTTIEEFGVAQ